VNLENQNVMTTSFHRQLALYHALELVIHVMMKPGIAQPAWNTITLTLWADVPSAAPDVVLVKRATCAIPAWTAFISLVQISVGIVPPTVSHAIPPAVV
jgi:hypothetical protein